MAASPAVCLAAGIRYPAPVYSTSPSATSARVVAASPSGDDCTVHAPTSPAAQADSGRAHSAALVADTQTLLVKPVTVTPVSTGTLCVCGTNWSAVAVFPA
ncbi:hypothetical protein PR003_g8478 [Phytophthora rubi]|uniref:Uncharacterized protein n=1 Tax=Phytophthora rubi TaxID=129364 RepID=A0A6A3N6D0_9STRA|nr:hypothetical protein PR002_g8222 [Phytophthora rubi]KAE9037230.1 hypothetical protein PR001_g8459 [Phytophthora rubi]KAE9344398.1 hypothetical protein PR003_g8478 [Phytophthora rubi]